VVEKLSRVPPAPAEEKSHGNGPLPLRQVHLERLAPPAQVCPGAKLPFPREALERQAQTVKEAASTLVFPTKIIAPLLLP